MYVVKGHPLFVLLCAGTHVIRCIKIPLKKEEKKEEEEEDKKIPYRLAYMKSLIALATTN